jgi:hypothetical protein
MADQKRMKIAAFRLEALRRVVRWLEDGHKLKSGKKGRGRFTIGEVKPYPFCRLPSISPNRPAFEAELSKPWLWRSEKDRR